MKNYDVIVVGAGPAGLFTAINLGILNKKVLILEKNKEAGKKLLLSGAGQCNITQAGDIKNYSIHYGENYKYIRNALQHFDNESTINFFEKRGLKMEVREDGKVFPKSYIAGDVLSLLLSECEKYNIEIRYMERVKNLSYSKEKYIIKTDISKYKSKYLVIATGGLSYPQTGSTGDGHRFAKNLGHKITKLLPALTPIEIVDYPFKSLAGISIEDLPMSIWRSNKKVKDIKGDVIFTHKGLSGPGILNNSRWIEKDDILSLNFIRKYNSKSFNEFLLKEFDKRGSELLKTVLRELDIPRRIIDGILHYINVDGRIRCAQVDKELRFLIVENLIQFQVTVSRLGGFHKAMVTSGGVSMKEVNPTTMESRLCENLYFAGEILDIDGDTGGYNIQAALSTGKLCADSIGRKGNQ